MAIAAWIVQSALTQLQLRQARKATQLDAVARVIEWLQSKEQRHFRSVLFEKKRLYADDLDLALDDDDYVDAADNAASAFQQVAFLARSRLIKRRLVLKNWQDNIIDTWSATQPWIRRRRVDQDLTGLWSSFEWLNRKAVKFKRRRAKRDRCLSILKFKGSAKRGS